MSDAPLLIQIEALLSGNTNPSQSAARHSPAAQSAEIRGLFQAMVARASQVSNVSVRSAASLSHTIHQNTQALQGAPAQSVTQTPWIPLMNAAPPPAASSIMPGSNTPSKQAQQSAKKQPKQPAPKRR